MKTDLLNFTENPLYSNMIVNGEFSLTWIKDALLIMAFIIALMFYSEVCPQKEILLTNGYTNYPTFSMFLAIFSLYSLY